MNSPRTLFLSAAAALAMVLVTGCSPKSDSSVGTTQPKNFTGVTTNPVAPYKFFTPTTEADLQNDAGTYGFLIAKVSADFNEATFGRLGLEVKGKFAMNGAHYYKLYKDANVLETLTMLQTMKGVAYAEADQSVKLDAGFAYDPGDPMGKSTEWSIYTTKLVDAWATYGFGTYTPVVADLDTGINFVHEDMQLDETTSVIKHAYSWWDLSKATAVEKLPSTTYDIEPFDYISGTLLDSTGAVITSTASPARDESHGCHTAGTIAAVGNNGKGFAGVCWQSDLFSYKVFRGTAADNWSIYGSLYHLMQWKKKNNYAHTIPVNMSLGGAGASNFAIEMVEACTENNIVIIASMGNDGQSLSKYPAAYQGVIAVGATNGQDKKVHFSTSGPHISVVAPGYDIISASDEGPDVYESMSGTSMAAPFVTGLVTYMLTFNPDLTPGQIRTYLEQNTDLIQGATGWNQDLGYGRVNALKTIGAVVADVNAHTAPATNYMAKPVRVTVQNTVGGVTTGMGGVPVYLYQCDPIGRITNFVGSTVTSSDPSGDPLLFPVGTADFNLLRPGTYVIRTNVTGNQAYTPMFTVAPDSDAMAFTIGYKLNLYNIETLPDAGVGSANTDDIIVVYDNATKRIIASVDSGNLDTAQVLTSTNQTLLVNIVPYASSYIGEYAMWIGTGLYGSGAATAPGTFAAPAAGAVLGSQVTGTTMPAVPQTAVVNTLYNGKLTTATDWYKVVCP